MPSAFSNWPLKALRYKRCVGSGRAYTAPGRVIAIAHNGILLRANQVAPAFSFSAVAEVFTLTFDPEQGDRIDALCISA